MIIGVDEVGRGAWAGPLVVGAVLLGGNEIAGLTDSKKLTKRQREQLDQEIRQKALGIGLGWVSAKHIDAIGLSEALKLASRRAVSHIRGDYSQLIIDGTIKLIDDPRAVTMKKADLLVPSVSAASIVAKVARDNYMRHLDTAFPGYSFGAHVGYGTAAHQAAIGKLGVTPLHRLSFAPLKQYATGPGEPVKVRAAATTKQIGDAAETVTAAYLEQLGHKILARNWRTKYCEIDIVSRRNNSVYFTEVKYRKTAAHGSGLEAITKKKYEQMQFAAELFVARYKLGGAELRLAAASLAGTPPTLEHFLELE